MNRLAWLALAAVTACSALLGDAPDWPPLDFATSTAYLGDPRPVIASGGAGRIDVTGSVSYACRPVTGTAAASGSRVTLTVHGGEPEGPCLPVIAYYGYEAAVRELPPGRYTIRVVHESAGQGSELVLEKDVMVR